MTHPNTLKRLRERTIARKAAGLIPEVYEVTERTTYRLMPSCEPLPVCVHEGVVLVPCHSCGSEGRHIRNCEIHGQVTRVECGKDVDMTCGKCRKEGLGYEPKKER